MATFHSMMDSRFNITNSSNFDRKEKEVMITTAYLETNYTLAVIYIVFLSINIIIGTIGNLTIIVSYSMERKLQETGAEFAINLAISDLLVVMIADPMCIIGVTHGEYVIEQIPGLCAVIAACCLTACFASFMSLALLTFNRYIVVCHNHWVQALFTPKKVIVMITCAWLLSGMCELPNFVGVGGHIFDPVVHQCIWDRTASVWYTYAVAIGLILAPLVLMLMAYGRIFWVVQNSSRAVHATLRVTNQQQWKVLWKKTRTLAVVVFAFLICWTPYCIVIMVDMSNELPAWVHLWTTLLAHTHASMNIIIYAATSERHYNVYKKILSTICFIQRCKKSPETSSVIAIIKSDNAINNVTTHSLQLESRSNIVIQITSNDKSFINCNEHNNIV